MTLRKECDVCHFARETVQRYGLTRQTVKTAEYPNTTWGMGSIDLCHECWGRIAQPRQRPQRRRRRVITVHGRFGSRTEVIPD